MIETASRNTPQLRSPKVDDGPALWELVRDSGSLDLNSPYAYLLLGEHFAETSIVAERQQQIVGFISAYRPPQQPGSLFVWQVGVAATARRQGLALQMLLGLLQRESCADIDRVITTITPDNQPSRRLFQTLASAVNGKIHEQINHFGLDHFPTASQHQPESLFTISPIQL